VLFAPKKTLKKVALMKTDYEEGRLQPTQAGYPQLATPLFLSPHDSLKKNSKKFIEIDEKRLRKKLALIKRDYEEGRMQPTPVGHPKGEPFSTGCPLRPGGWDRNRL
jgi:hypothetical protein